MKKSQKRLAFFLPALYGGGAERVILNLAAGIAGQGYAVDLVLAQAEGPYLDDVPDTIRLVVLNQRRRNYSRTLASLPALIRYLRKTQPCAMLSGLHANIIALWAKRFTGIPKRLVISEHNTFSTKHEQLPKRFRLVMSRFVSWFYPWASHIVAVSDGVADDLARAAGLPRDRIQVIYNPVITPQLQAKAEAPFEHPWFEPNEPPVILAVGRLNAQKDFEGLVKAFARVRKTRVARLIILGEGEDRPKVEKLVAQLELENDVRLPGFVSNPYAYMARTSLFVLSSRWEGLPTVLVEALYCGAPIVSTDCPSGPSEILQGGQYGKLVPVGDVDALAKAIEESLDSTTPLPPPLSWQPFESDTIINQYKGILLGV